MKILKIFVVCLLLISVFAISCFAVESPFNFLYVTQFDSAQYSFTLLDNTLSDEPIYLYPGVKYYLTLTIDSGLFDSIGSSYYVRSSDNKTFIHVSTNGNVALDGNIHFDISYFDPQVAGGAARSFLVTVDDRIDLSQCNGNSAVTSVFYYYDGQQGMIDAGNGVMSVLTSFINECLLHWNLLLFCIVIPVISVAVAIIVSFRERRESKK